MLDSLTPSDIRDAGYEIVKDDETDAYRFRARLFVEDSGLCDTPEQAAKACRIALGLEHRVRLSPAVTAGTIRGVRFFPQFH
ncbi:hypothetical protein [Microvirga massiliensis]|uniref:hypothetical protein n=1 Tax=Microvirga massiliensis TaxID=1033741 RepID=UPI00062BBE83|nr:hypothetical protein [Microvirga massiliensis]